MIIAIDETGAFEAGSRKVHFFASAIIRSSSEPYIAIKNQFDDWESSLNPSLKSPQGEFKSSNLPDEALLRFVREVIISEPYVYIDAFRIRPSENPLEVIEKHKALQVHGIEEGSKLYLEQGKEALSKRYTEFGNWFSNLSYQQYLKIVMLGKIIVSSLSKSIGTAIASDFDHELINLKFLIDKDHIRGPEQNSFWREILRNQLYFFSHSYPLTLLDTWQNTGHPFLDKYKKGGKINLNRLFWENCSYEDSSQHFEIRLSDAVNTILSRYHNLGRNEEAYRLLIKLLMMDQKIVHIVLPDFDLEERKRNRGPNPWAE